MLVAVTCQVEAATHIWFISDDKSLGDAPTTARGMESFQNLPEEDDHDSPSFRMQLINNPSSNKPKCHQQIIHLLLE
jgi:hypothetical protein